MSKKQLVFDCDGTLISSLPTLFKGTAWIASELLQKKVTEEEVRRAYDADFVIMYANLGLKEEMRSAIEQKWSEWSMHHELSYELFPGIRELIEQSESLGHDLYVWTARDKQSTIDILSGLNLIKHFIDIRSGSCTPIKPHVRGLEELVGGQDRKLTYVIGDSYTDVKGAKAFGAYAIGANWCSHAKAELLSSFGADWIAENPLDCLTIIQEEVK